MSDSTDARTVWEEHYRAKPQVWSGRVNARLAEIAAELTPGRALDLGCGEGADAVWLAEQGWWVTAVDVSGTALERARGEAERRNVSGRIEFRAQDLADPLPQGPFDLVSAQFLHSTVEMDRAAILGRAAATVAPGGSLLVVDHAAAPPWAEKMRHHHFPDAETVLAGLGLDDGDWQRVRVGTAERAAVGPDGVQATLTDNILWMRRSA